MRATSRRWRPLEVLRGCNPPLSDLTCPVDPITRGQMAALLRRSLKLPPAPGDSFADDEGSTFEEDINRVAAAGITRGCDAADASRFCPDELVTRGQMAAFINRGFELEPGSKDRFSDDDSSPFERGHRPGCLRRHHRGLRPGLPEAVLSTGSG